MQEITAPFNIAIIAVTAIVSYLGFTKYGFAERYLFDSQRILADKQYYRIVSSGALHGSWGHLIFNMFSLYSFGSEIELHFGWVQFLTIYFVSIIGGSLLSLVLHRNHEYRAIGASGGVCGIIFACIFLLPGSSVYIFFIPIPIPAYIFAVVFLAVSYFGLRGQVGNIGHDAHIGGAIIGLAVTTAMYPYIITENPVLYPVVMGLALIMLVLLYLHPLYLSRAVHKTVRSRPQQQEREGNYKPPAEPTDEEILESLREKVSKSGSNSLTYVEMQRLERILKQRKEQQKDTNQQ
ncbi:MAG: rhomboid family intramembrane serine protease [Phycisphaerales bacterium]|jgi:membrane associated rhomboid family serine protease